MNNIKRKGARRVKDIPPEVLKQLNRGEIETANLVEWLAVDQGLLLKNLLTHTQRKGYLEPVLSKIAQLKKQTVNTINEAIGKGLLEQVMLHHDETFLMMMTKHPSDIVRCWACYLVGKNERLSIAQIMHQMIPFAADKHFGVREISWMAVRQKIILNLEESIVILSKWTSDEDENIRRFASEASRPRGVWCEHIEALKQNPALAMPILEPLKSDPAKYVRDSLGNWLNDAAKTQPGFVKELCKRWEKESGTKETKYIVKKALRSIDPSSASSTLTHTAPHR